MAWSTRRWRGRTGFLDTASADDLRSLFATPTPTPSTTDRLGLFMKHYPRLTSPMQQQVDQMIADEMAHLQADLVAQRANLALGNATGVYRLAKSLGAFCDAEEKNHSPAYVA